MAGDGMCDNGLTDSMWLSTPFHKYCLVFQGDRSLARLSASTAAAPIGAARVSKLPPNTLGYFRIDGLNL
jgi:hypothetical protein